MITQGQIVFVRTSEEPVFVLRVYDVKAEDSLTGAPAQAADVRRPVATEDGTMHLLDTFLVDELETYEDQLQRQLKQLTARRDAAESLNQPKAAVPTIQSVKPN
jgi:hypothetical protein